MADTNTPAPTRDAGGALLRILETKRDRPFTDLQRGTLLAYLNSGCSLKPRDCAVQAGYNVASASSVVGSLRNEIIALTEMHLVANAGVAVTTIVNVMEADAPIPNVTAKLDAAKTVLDRIGLGKQDRLEVENKVSGGIFIMPAKTEMGETIAEGEYSDA